METLSLILKPGFGKNSIKMIFFVFLKKEA